MGRKKRMRAMWGIGGLLALAQGLLVGGCDQIVPITPSIFIPLYCTPMPGTCGVSPLADITVNINGDPVLGDTTSGPNNFVPYAGPDALYVFTICYPRQITISTCGGAAWDTVLRLRKDDCNALNLSIDDDGCGSGLGPSILSENLAAGTYFVVLDGYGGSSFGSYSLTISSP